MAFETAAKSGTNAARLEVAVLRYRKLSDMRIRIEADVERYTAELKKISEEAEKEFGTSDPKKLLVMADEAEARDAAAITEFENSLNRAAEELRKIEQAS